jgi:hypothetical protein
VLRESTVECELRQLERELHGLEAEYNMFFAGQLAKLPNESRSHVDGAIRRWDRSYVQSHLDRFRFSTLRARYATFTGLWDRELRAREEGRTGPLGRRPTQLSEVA